MYRSSFLCNSEANLAHLSWSVSTAFLSQQATWPFPCGKCKAKCCGECYILLNTLYSFWLHAECAFMATSQPFKGRLNGILHCLVHCLVPSCCSSSPARIQTYLMENEGHIEDIHQAQWKQYVNIKLQHSLCLMAAECKPNVSLMQVWCRR